MIIIMIIIVPETQETRSKVLDPTCKKINNRFHNTRMVWFTHTELADKAKQSDLSYLLSSQ